MAEKNILAGQCQRALDVILSRPRDGLGAKAELKCSAPFQEK